MHDRLNRRPIPREIFTEQLTVKLSERVALTDEGCLIWIGARGTCSLGPREYPLLTLRVGEQKITFLVSRLVYAWATGIDPGQLEVDHREGCPKLCVHPAHLTAMTHAENVRKWAATITHCPHGHEYSSENTYLARTRTGGQFRVCRSCNRDRQRSRHAQRKDLKSHQPVSSYILVNGELVKVP